jgi:hypothetical protein
MILKHFSLSIHFFDRNSQMRATMCKLLLYLLLILILPACEPSEIPPSPSPTSFPTRTPTVIPTATSTPQPANAFIDPDLPGSEPQRFGETFFSGSFHSAPVFSPDGQTVWWGGEYGSATIYTSQLRAGTWSDPAIISFSESMHSFQDPFISPDGQKFYFISADAIPGISTAGKENIWMMEKQGEGWSEPQPLPSSINALELHWTVSVASNYNLYFSAQNEGNTDIFLSRYINGVYTEPIPLESPVNTAEIELTPNIAPDENYLLFTRIVSRTDPPHLYIAYRLDTGWSEPLRVENITYCISPIVTPDRLFVIYLSSPSSFEWRDTSFIEALRP